MSTAARRLLVSLGLALIALPVWGQTPFQTAPQDVGTAVIRGRVLASDSGQPLRRAQVQIMGTETRFGRMVTTDAVGRYSVTELPAGRYMLRISQAPYLEQWYGQTGPRDSGKPLDVADGQTLEVDFALVRGGVMTGRVLDEFGEPAEEARVTVLRADRSVSSGLTVGGPTAVADDLGAFRLFGLVPGEYVLAAVASTRVVGPRPDTGRPTEYVRTYFPNTTDPARAETVTIAGGQTVSNVLIALVPGRGARVTGAVVDSQGRPMSGQMVASMRESQNLGPGGLARGPIRPDGSFTLDRLTPGRYLLQAVNAAGNERASTEVVVSGADLEGVRLVGMKAVVASGRLISDSALPLSLRPGTLMVMVSPIDDTGAVPLSAFTRPAPVNDDWTFETQAWPGRVRLMVVGSDEWMVRSIRHRGSDVTDTGIEFASGADLSDIEIELTSRVAQVVGTVTGGGGQLATEFSVLVFPEDSERRALGARYIRTARPDQYGQFRIGLLPAGTYRAIALERLDGDDARDLEFLDRLARVAASFTLLEGESKTVRLPLHALPE